jgi:hypothetical protein
VVVSPVAIEAARKSAAFRDLCKAIDAHEALGCPQGDLTAFLTLLNGANDEAGFLDQDFPMFCGKAVQVLAWYLA